VEIEPPLIGQKYGLGEHDLAEVIIIPRHEGDFIANVALGPVSVHVARSLVGNLRGREIIGDNELHLIAWAEIYKSEEDARRK
jgi:hypothetical protein